MGKGGSTLSWPDYLILLAFLVISLGIGVYHSLTGGRQRTIQEFIMSNRRLKILPTAISLLVTNQSAILILGSTAEIYLYGVQLMITAPISIVIGIFITERLIVPWIYRMNLVSVYEYLERRFQSKSVRIFGALVSMLSTMMYIGVATYAPSAALEAAVGLPMVLSIPLMSVICIAYTALGGMRAVIWTDVFQCGIMLAGLLTVLIKGTIAVGGAGEVFRLLGEEGRLEWINWSPDPTVRHTIWGFLFGYSTLYIQMYGIKQASAQRFSATGSLRQARISVLANIPGLILLYCITLAVGLTVVAHYAKTMCDPLKNKEIHNANQLLAHFVSTMFSDVKGFPGLFLATLYGGALSTVSSSLSGAAANFWEDILKWKLDSRFSESRKALVNRILVILIGLLSTGISFLAAGAPGTVNQVAVALGGSMMGPLCGVFFLGGITRHSNWKGALVGGTVGLVINVWLNFGSLTLTRQHPVLPPLSVDECYNLTTANMTWLQPSNQTQNVELPPLSGIERLYSLSYVWYTTLGILTTVVVGLIISLITWDKTAAAELDDRLLISYRELWSGLSEDEVHEEPQSEPEKNGSPPETVPLKEDPSKLLMQDTQVNLVQSVA